MNYGLTCNGKLLTTDYSNILGIPDPYNPYNLPAKTFRAQYKQNTYPTTKYCEVTLVDSVQNIYDITYTGAYYSPYEVPFQSDKNLTNVLGANTTDFTSVQNLFMTCSSLQSMCEFDSSNITNMASMFGGCNSLTSIKPIDMTNVSAAGSMFAVCDKLSAVNFYNTSNVKYFNHMFFSCTSLRSLPAEIDITNAVGALYMCYNCYALTSVPTLTTSATPVTDNKLMQTDAMFFECNSVQSGALAAYQKLASLYPAVSSHNGTFHSCGNATPQGIAELAQIPDDWK